MRLFIFFIFIINLYANAIYDKTINILNNLKETGYRHHNFIITKDKIFVDCRGFVDYIVKSEYPSLYSKMKQLSNHSCRRVLAADYVEFFKNHTFNESQTINFVKDIQKGDIIAYKLHNAYIQRRCKNGKIIYLTKCKRYYNHKCILRQNTGHVFIALDTPKKYKNYYLLKIADSTTFLHHNDSRTHSGVGYGYIILHDYYIKIHHKKIPLYIGRLK